MNISQNILVGSTLNCAWFGECSLYKYICIYIYINVLHTCLFDFFCPMFNTRLQILFLKKLYKFFLVFTVRFTPFPKFYSTISQSSNISQKLPNFPLEQSTTRIFPFVSVFWGWSKLRLEKSSQFFIEFTMIRNKNYILYQKPPVVIDTRSPLK